jgi:hypothetical protein
MLAKSTGWLQYSIVTPATPQAGVDDNGDLLPPPTNPQTANYYRLVLNVCQDLSDFYRKQVPKHIAISQQKYRAHISVIRNEVPANLDIWEKYAGHEVEFQYEPFPMNDERYWWITCWSTRLEEIRVELGLPVAVRPSHSPYGSNRFHFTFGNTKTL